MRLRGVSRSLGEPAERHAFVQFLFFRQLASLRAYAKAKGIGLIGDLPIFVAADSADVWTHPDLFQLDEAHRPRVVAGVPPDYFSATGQRSEPARGSGTSAASPTGSLSAHRAGSSANS